MNIDRLHRYQSNPEYRRLRTAESLGRVYTCHYPAEVLHSARDARRSPFHDRFAAAGAFFRETSGWETPDWFAGDGQVPNPGPLRWTRQDWFPQWAAEHQAARNDVVLMDMSFMGRFLVQGRDAGRWLDWLSGNAVDGSEGQITYTPWMNAAGRLEADLTVAKLAADRFLVVATDTAVRHVETWLRRQIPADAHAFVTDLGGAWAQLNLQGPRSRELLQSLTSVNLSNAAFPFRTIREIDLGLARVLCARLTYVGELGYELHIPVEQAVHVYDRLVAAGIPFGLRHAGLKALSSLRLEKGYRDYGHDLDNTDGPLEAGLGFALDFRKPGGFLGREAVERVKSQGPLCRRLCQVLLLDPDPLMFHGEVVLRDGIPVGYVRAASYGHTLGGAVGLAMIEPGARPHPALPVPVAVDEAFLATGHWEVEVAGRRHAARVSLRPFYDPTLARVRG